MSDHLKPGSFAKFWQSLRQRQENPQVCSATLTQLHEDVDGLFNKVETVRAGLLQVEPHLAAQNGTPEQQDPDEHSATLTKLHEDIDGLSNYIDRVRMGLVQVELDLATPKGGYEDKKEAVGAAL